MKKILDQYVYRNLEHFGNAMIGNKTYEKFGEEKILKDLEKHGFKCKFKIIDYHIKDYGNPLKNSSYLDRTVIVEVI